MQTVYHNIVISVNYPLADAKGILYIYKTDEHAVLLQIPGKF